MSKAFICDICGKAVPEDELVPKDGIDVHVEFKKYREIIVNINFLKPNRSSNIDVCRECGKDLVFKTLRKLEKEIAEASKKGHNFSIA